MRTQVCRNRHRFPAIRTLLHDHLQKGRDQTAPSAGFVSDAETNCNNRSLVNFVSTAGGGGGRSALYSKPVWQAGLGVPADGARDIPDVSLFSGSAQSGNIYLFCEADLQNGAPCVLGDSGYHVQGAVGTSISGPAFAGVMALVVQNSNLRQGNPNAILYTRSPISNILLHSPL